MGELAPSVFHSMIPSCRRWAREWLARAFRFSKWKPQSSQDASKTKKRYSEIDHLNYWWQILNVSPVQWVWEIVLWRIITNIFGLILCIKPAKSTVISSHPTRPFCSNLPWNVLGCYCVQCSKWLKGQQSNANNAESVSRQHCIVSWKEYMEKRLILRLKCWVLKDKAGVMLYFTYMERKN